MHRTTLLVMVLLVTLASCCMATSEQWDLWASDTQSFIYFAFDNRNLSINAYQHRFEIYGQGQWRGYQLWEVFFTGVWATTGTLSDDGVMTPDPYATFVIESDGVGHVQWAPGTPVGYRAPVVVGGYRLRPDGGHWISLTMRRTWYDIEFGYDITNEDRQHTFYADYVPEPGSIVALLAGLAGLAWRRRR